jgi:hypothetical protein
MMSKCDIAYVRPPREGEEGPDLERLKQIAVAAGHGHGHLGVFSRPKPWYTLEDNVRPSYDVHFIQTFNPDMVEYLLRRLEAAERISRCVDESDLPSGRS